MSAEPMPPVVAVTEARALPGVRAVVFTASAFVEHNDRLEVVSIEAMLAWVRENPRAALIHAEFSGWDDTAQLYRKRGTWAMLTESTFSHSVTLYYEVPFEGEDAS